MKNKRHCYTEEEIEFLKNNVKGITLKELTEKFNKKFECNVTKSAIVNRKTKYNLKSEINTGWFKKGYIPYHKGTKGIQKANSGSFKKGNIPHNTKEIGAERITADNFIEIKVSNPNKWRLKHHVIYEKAHNVKIGRWDKVIFLDGNKRNFDINNLELLTNSEQTIMATHKFKNENSDIMKSYVALSKLLSKIKKKEKV